MQSKAVPEKVSERVKLSFFAFCSVFILSTIGYILAFGGLYWFLHQYLAKNLTLMVASAVPAFFIGLSFFQLLHYFDRRFSTRNTDTIIFDKDDLDSISSKNLHSHNLSGHTIGAYELENVIGRGGMAEVYRAVGNDVMVAIKLMYPLYRYDEEFVERFYREGMFGIGMNNPYIAAVYEIAMYEETPYIVMEYVEGEDLGEILERREYTFEDVALWMGNICKALDIVHSEGYVHRDIKPGNIMVRDSDGEAILMDFGLAKFHKASRITEVSIGTLGYMAPEQILSSQEIDYRADIYSLSVVCYELLTGILPFDGNTAQIMYAHMNYARPNPRSIDPSIPKYLARAVMKAMAIDPNERFQSAGEFANALRGIPESSI